MAGTDGAEPGAGGGLRGPNRLAALLENSPVGLAVVAPDGAFLEVNPALVRMLGRDEEALTAATWQELTHPDDVPADLALVSEVLAGRRDAYQSTKRYLRPDGAVVWANLSVSCVRDGQGSVQFFILQVVDVTEMVEVRHRIEKSEARYRMMAENSSDFVVLTDPEGVVEWASDSVEGVLGWSPSLVVGLSSGDFVDPEDVPEMFRLHRLANAGQEAAGRIRIRAVDGTFRWFHRTLRAVHDENGALTP